MKPINNSLMNSIAAAINDMNLTELHMVIDMASNQIDAKAEMHRLAIEQAISSAIEDGFDVSFWVEGDSDYCAMLHNDDHAKHIAINQWHKPLIFFK